MWLLNATTKRLECYEGSNVPKCAILSHRWETEEVLYQDVIENTAHEKAGYFKIEQCCEQAKKDGYDYVWVDTCCIDRKSNAELSEAINSMYRWYKKAEVCYAFLSDIQLVDHHELSMFQGRSFSQSVWFTRGWTLQEMLAPRRLEFYDRTWTSLGSRAYWVSQIHEATSIPEAALGMFQTEKWSIAAKMSWASKRCTARIEDQAYSLLGLFQVNMPLLYGEGPNAFLRLQEEICRTTTDRSLFAWSHRERGLNVLDESYDTEKVRLSSAFFAPHITCFENQHASGFYEAPQRSGRSNYGMMSVVHNHGLALDVRLYPLFDTVYAAALCRSTIGQKLCIYVQRLGTGQGQEHARIELDGVWSMSTDFSFLAKGPHPTISTILIRQDARKLRTEDVGDLCFEVYFDRDLLQHSDDATSSDEEESTQVSDYEENHLDHCKKCLFVEGPFVDNGEEDYPPVRNMLHEGARPAKRFSGSLLVQKVHVSWRYAAGSMACLYFTDASTQELVVIVLGLDTDFEPFTITQVWPSDLSRKARKHFGFSQRGFNQLQIPRCEKWLIDMEFGKLFERWKLKSRTLVRSKGVQFDRTDVIRIFVSEGNSYLLDTRYADYAYDIKSTLERKCWEMFISKFWQHPDGQLSYMDFWGGLKSRTETLVCGRADSEEMLETRPTAGSSRTKLFFDILRRTMGMAIKKPRD